MDKKTNDPQKASNIKPFNDNFIYNGTNNPSIYK